MNKETNSIIFSSHGFSLIQMVVAMGLISIGLLVALQASKFQMQTTKRLSNKSSEATGAIIGIKDIKKNLTYATNLNVVSENQVSYEKYRMVNNEFIIDTFQYVLSDECGKRCLTLKRNGKTIRLFPSVQDIKFCYTNTSASCTEYDDITPDQMDLNKRRIIVKFTFYNQKSNNTFLVINLKNIKNDNTSRDDYYFIEG